MSIIIYIVAIVVVALGVCLFFFLNSKADKKRVANLKGQQNDQKITPVVEQSVRIEPVAEQEKTIDAQLEDFCLDSEQQMDLNVYGREMPSRTSMFSQKKMEQLFSETDDFNNESDLFVASDDMNKKFDDYEKFLRENLDFDDEDLDISEDDNTSNKEFDEFLKTLSPKAREFMMAEVLTKKNIDSEED